MLLFFDKRVANYCCISQIPVRVFLPKCAFTTVRSRLSAEEQQWYPRPRLGQFVVWPH